MSIKSGTGSNRVRSLPAGRVGPNDAPRQRPHFRRDGSGPTPGPIRPRPNAPRAPRAGGGEYYVPNFDHQDGAHAINARQRQARRDAHPDNDGAAEGLGWILGIFIAALFVGGVIFAAIAAGGNETSGSTGRVANPAQFTSSYTPPVTSGFSSGSSPASPFGVTNPTSPMLPLGTTNQLNPMSASQFDAFNQVNRTNGVNPMSPFSSVNQVIQPTIGMPGTQLNNSSFGSGGSRGGTSSFGSGSRGFSAGSFGSVGSPSAPGFP